MYVPSTREAELVQEQVDLGVKCEPEEFRSHACVYDEAGYVTTPSKLQGSSLLTSETATFCQNLVFQNRPIPTVSHNFPIILSRPKIR